MSYNNNVLGQSGAIFFFGVVEDNNDPEKLGRVKVRVHGIHNRDKGVLPTVLLPWASVSVPVTENESSMPDLYPGTTVFGFFLDGDEMQVPFVTGIVPGIDANTEQTTIAPHAAQLARASEAKKNRIFDEPTDAYSAQYPHNRAKVTKSGHVIEFDDTPGAERIHFFHTSGAYIEFLPDGRIVQKSVGDQFIVASGNQSIKASDGVSVEAGGEVSLKAGGSGSISASGPLSVKSDSAMDLAGSAISLAAGGAVIALGGGGTEMTGNMNSSGVVTAVDVVGGGYSLASIGSAIDAGGGLDALAGAISGAGLGAIIGDAIDDALSGGVGGWGSTDLTAPIAPVSFAASAGVTQVIVTHSEPAFTVGGGYKATHIYMTEWFPGLPRPTLSNAAVVHTYTGTNSSFPAEAGKRYVVWARWESKAGVFSEAAPDEVGLLVETGQNVQALTELIRQQILTSELYATLRSELGLNDLADSVAWNATVTQEEINRRRAEIKKEQQARVDALIAEAVERGAAITTERNERQTALSSVAQEIVTITAAVDGNAAAIQAESVARADALTAEAAQRTLLAGRVDTAEAAITTETSLRVSADTAIASDVTTLTTRVGDAESSITQEISTRASETGHIASKYAVRTTLTSGGRTVVGGFGLVGTSSPTEGPTIDFGVAADRFWIGAPSSAAGIPDSLPFTVQTTPTTVNGQSVSVGVYISDAFIMNGTITNAKIANLAVDNAKIANLDAAKITTGFISADRIDSDTITAEKIFVESLSVLSPNLGSITGGSLNINSGIATIDSNGNAQFKSLQVVDGQGRTVLSVTPTTSSFQFPDVLANIPEYINNDSLFIDANGNLSSGISKTPSDPTNLVDYSVFVAGPTLPVGWSEYNAGKTAVIETTGPKGIPTLVIQAVDSDTALSSEGGFANSVVLDPVPGAIYRVVQPIRRVTATAIDGFIGHGPGPAFAPPEERVYNKDGTTLNSNPYWIQLAASSFVPGEWYISIGYVFPSGTINAVNPPDAGVYKLSDGSLLSAGNTSITPFVFNTAANTLGWTTRGIFYSSTTIGAEFHFGVPFIHEVDGTEPTIDAMFKGVNLRTLGFTGDLNATNGAPAGTLVGTVPAENVNNWNHLANVPYSTIFNNDDSTSLGFNPAFADWPIANPLPTGWSAGQPSGGGTNTNVTITRETNSTFVRVGANSVKMVTTAAASGILRLVSVASNPFPAGTFLSGTVDIYMGARTAGLPGIVIRLYTNVGLTTFTDTQANPPNTQVGVWHRVPWSARLLETEQIYGIAIYLVASMPSWTNSAANNFVGTVYFDNMRFMLADKSTDNISVKLSETAGTLSLVGGGAGSVTTITANNKLSPGNVDTYMAPLTVQNVHIGNIIKSDNYEMYNLIRDFVANPASNYSVTLGAGITIATALSNVTGAAGAITGYTATRVAFTGTSGGGYLTSVKSPISKKPVSAGDIVEAHMYVQCLNGTARLMVEFFDGAGASISTTIVAGGGGVATMPAATTALSTLIANFVHLSGFVTAPANATSMQLVIQVARTSTAGNTDLYMNIPSIAVVMDSATLVHTWPATSGIGGAGWILNKTTGMEINAVNVRGKLVTDQLEVGSVTSTVLQNYRPLLIFRGNMYFTSGISTALAMLENVHVPITGTTVSTTWTPTAGVYYAMAIYNWVSTRVGTDGYPKHLHFKDIGITNNTTGVNFLKRTHSPFADQVPAGETATGSGSTFGATGLLSNRKYECRSSHAFQASPAPGGGETLGYMSPATGDQDGRYTFQKSLKVGGAFGVLTSSDPKWSVITKVAPANGVMFQSVPTTLSAVPHTIAGTFATQFTSAESDLGVYFRIISGAPENQEAKEWYSDPYDMLSAQRLSVAGNHPSPNPNSTSAVIVDRTDVIDITVDVNIQGVLPNLISTFGSSPEYRIDMTRLVGFIVDRDDINQTADPYSQFVNTSVGVDIFGTHRLLMYMGNDLGIQTASVSTSRDYLDASGNSRLMVSVVKSISKRVRVADITTKANGPVTLAFIFGGPIRVYDSAGNWIPVSFLQPGNPIPTALAFSNLTINITRNKV